MYRTTAASILSTTLIVFMGVARPGVSRMSHCPWKAAICRPSRCAVWVART